MAEETTSWEDGDVTERIPDEAKGIVSDKQLWQFIGHAPMALAIFDREMCYLAASHRWISDYGIDENNFMGRSQYEIFPETSESWKDVHSRALAGEVVCCDEDRFVRTDGRIQWLRWEVRPWFTEDGDIGGIVMYTEDITKQKEAELALLESEERMRATVNSAVDAIITIDHRGTILGVNPATERIFGYRGSELIGRNVKLLMPPPYSDEHDNYIKRYLETGEAKIIGIGREVMGLHKDGTAFPIDLAISQIDHLGLFTGTIRDITERKAEHTRLLQAERLAAIGEAMAGLTHESRNALARSQANLRRLSRQLKDRPELLELIDAAIVAQEDVRHHFEDVRQYAAPMKLRREPTDIRKLLIEAWEKLSMEWKNRDAHLVETLTEAEFVCQIDQFSLRNTFRNILENSLAACGDPVRIEVRFQASQLGGAPALQISIRDNGPGFPPKMAELAFDAFHTTKTHGTGLGLAIVKRTVEEHGGCAAIGSSGGSGAEIILTLPRG